MGRRARATGHWLDALLACPACGARLESDGGGPHGVLRCAACGPYPRLAGVPVLAPSPAEWCAVFRESVLASLAEVDAASPDAVAVVDAFAAAAPGAEPRRFGDDWTAREASSVPEGGEGGGAGKSPLRALLGAARRAGPAALLTKRLPQAGVAVEVGCGAGVLSAALAQRARRLVVADLSLRAVLRARARAIAAGGDVAGVVLDAEALPFASGAVDLLLAENVVDLLDAPADFFASAHRVVARGGRVLLTTPEPSLGSDDDGQARALAELAGFRVAARADGLPWTRVHSARFVEVYVAQALELRQEADVRTKAGRPRRNDARRSRR